MNSVEWLESRQQIQFDGRDEDGKEVSELFQLHCLKRGNVWQWRAESAYGEPKIEWQGEFESLEAADRDSQQWVYQTYFIEHPD